MPVQFEIDTTDRDIASEFEDAFFEYLMDAATVGYNHALELAPEDRGTLKQTSFAPERRTDGVVYGFTAPYAEAQEYGTEPYYPPLQPLLEWSQRVSGGLGLGFYVARHKIPTEGITEKRFARDGRDRQEEWLQNHDVSDYTDIFDD
ncbi:neck protein [Haloquadratum phage sp.]|nr:neck protein [Haloquadratum phage sp.]